MRCANCESVPVMTLVLFPEGSKALGLGYMLQNNSEVP